MSLLASIRSTAPAFTSSRSRAATFWVVRSGNTAFGQLTKNPLIRTGASQSASTRRIFSLRMVFSRVLALSQADSFAVIAGWTSSEILLSRTAFTRVVWVRLGNNTFHREIFFMVSIPFLFQYSHCTTLRDRSQSSNYTKLRRKICEVCLLTKCRALQSLARGQKCQVKNYTKIGLDFCASSPNNLLSRFRNEATAILT